MGEAQARLKALVERADIVRARIKDLRDQKAALLGRLVRVEREIAELLREEGKWMRPKP